MLKDFFFFFVIGAVLVYPLTIGSCIKFSPNEQKCQQCVPNYHAYQGQCYVDIIGCSAYKFGNICYQCDKNYILVNNACCDHICMNKLFSKFKKPSTQNVNSTNVEALNQLIRYNVKNYIQKSNARLVSIEFKQFDKVKRFFFLYQFYSIASNYYRKRLVLDYIASEKKIIPIDWVDVNDSLKFAEIQWTKVQNYAQVLKLYDQLYPAHIKYSEIVVRNATVNLVQQYQIATKLGNVQDLKILYSFQGKIQVLYHSQKTIETLPIQVSTSFAPYKKIYKESQIEKNLLTNSPLKAVIKAVRANPRFNHSLAQVSQEQTKNGIIEFEIFGKNNVTGSFIKYNVQFNVPTSGISIINIREQFVQNPDVIQESKLPDINKKLIPIIVPEYKFEIINDGLASHYHYYQPLDKLTYQFTMKIKDVLDKEVAKSKGTPEPILRKPNMTFRRLVITNVAANLNEREITYVQVDPSVPNRQYFSYFIERSFPTHQWFFMGSNEKNQTKEVFADPRAYPIHQSDPSYIVSPDIKFFQTEGVKEEFIQNLNNNAKAIAPQLNNIDKTQVNRKLGKVMRFNIDMTDKVDLKNRYQAIGYKTLKPTNQLPKFISYLIQNKIIDGETSYRSEIKKNVIGQQTVKTNKLKPFLKEDQILKGIIKLVQAKKPQIANFTLNEISVSEYEQLLQYQTVFSNKNVKNESNFVPSTRIVAVAFYNDSNHESKLVSVGVTEIKRSTTGPAGTTTTPNTVLPITKPIMNQADRIKMLLKNVISKLQKQKNVTVPQEIEIEQKVDKTTGDVTFRLVFDDKNGKTRVVTAIGDLNTQDNAVILEIVQIIPEQIEKIIKLPAPINPNPIPTNPTNPSPPTPIEVSKPSQTVLITIQERASEQATIVEGEMRKIKINPDLDKLGTDLKAIIGLVNQQDKFFRNNKSLQNPTSVKYIAIELAATSVQAQYAFTIKTTYPKSVLIRRHFVVKSLSNKKSFYVGSEQLPATFDVNKAENRFFKSFEKVEKSKLAASELPEAVINVVNKNRLVKINKANVESLKFRKFPSGTYIKAGIVTSDFVALAYVLTLSNDSILFKFNNPAIVQLINNSTSGNNSKPTKPSQPTEIYNAIQNQNTLSINNQVDAIEVSIRQKLNQVLKFISAKHHKDLEKAELKSDNVKENMNSNKVLESIEFNLQYAKNIDKNTDRKFFVTALRREDGNITELAYKFNDVKIKQSVSVKPFNINQDLQDTQQQTNSNLTIIDSNEVLYKQASDLISKDSQKKSDDVSLDLKTFAPESLNAIVKFIRAEYLTVRNSKILAVIQTLKTNTVQKYRIYFFKEVNSNSALTYQLFKCVIEYKKENKQNVFNVISFELFANNNGLTSTKDLSLQDDTDIAFGYTTIELRLVPQDKNVQNIIKEINNKYKNVLVGYKLYKVELLQLKDGRLNYKLLFSDSTNTLQCKFIVFYQPTLQKVLVLNTVNLPNKSQYSQLSMTEQQADRTLSSVTSFITELHPKISGFEVRSVSKASIGAEVEYNVVVEKTNKKYRSIVRIASNKIDMTEIQFSELAEISLDHYRLDQFDELLIMNYQKLSDDEMRTDSKFRIVLNHLYMSKKMKKVSLIGAACKSQGLGHVYKVYFKLDQTAVLFVAEIYLDAFSNKITTKSYKKLGLQTEFISISLQESAITKVINFLKEKNEFTGFTVKQAGIKDFLFGNLYKLTFTNTAETFDVYVYNDHSTEEVTQLFNKVVPSTIDQCTYNGATCASCKSPNYRVSGNKCAGIISNCATYSLAQCSSCKAGSKLFNGVCIAENQCGALCRTFAI